MATYSKASGASLERYLRHWRERGALMKMSAPQKVTPRMTIALSRESGVGGSGVAAAVAESLDWPVYDRELMERIADDTGVETQLLESIDEKSPRWLAESLDGFRHEKTMSGSGFAIRLLKILFALSGHGNCVLVGRGAAQVLPAKSTLRVRLIAPLEDRVACVQEQTGMTKDKAKAYVGDADKQRAAFVKGYFQKDVCEPHGYDLLINPLTFGIDRTAKIILRAQSKLAEALGTTHQVRTAGPK